LRIDCSPSNLNASGVCVPSSNKRSDDTAFLPALAADDGHESLAKAGTIGAKPMPTATNKNSAYGFWTWHLFVGILGSLMMGTRCGGSFFFFFGFLKTV
jgi:hypothetical protein